MTRSASVFLVCAAALVLWYVAAAGGGFPLDDSWIHQTFGRNLALHGEWSFLLGHPVAASTSPLYTVLLSLGYRLGVPYALWTHGLGALALAATALIGAAWARRALPSQAFAPWIVGAALLTTWHHIWAAAAGMETLIFAALVLALLVWPWWDAPASLRGRLAWGAAFGVVSACAVLARPEGIVAVGVVGLVLLWREMVSAYLGATHGSPANGIGDMRAQQRAWHAMPLQWIFGAGMAFVLVMAPNLILNLQLTGGLLPNTAAAKFQQHELLLTLPLFERIQRLLVAILAGGQVALIPGIVIYGWAGLRRAQHTFGDFVAAPLHISVWELARWLLPLIWAAGLIIIYALRLPADYQHGRYVLPALPALVMMGSAGLCLVWHHAREARTGVGPLLRRVLIRAWAIVLVMLYAYYLVAGRETYRVDVAIIDGEMVNAAHWIHDNLPDNELLAIHDIGAVGYFAPRPMLDIAGLITPQVVPLIGQPEALWGLMQAQDARYLLAFPDQIPGGNAFDPRLCPIYSTNAAITQQVGHANMQIYRLAWNQDCTTTANTTEDEP